MREIEENRYYMQLCLDTRTNRQIKFEEETWHKAKEIMKTMKRTEAEIERELVHFKYMKEQLRKLIRSRGGDTLDMLEKERARLREELPKAIARWNAEKAAKPIEIQ